VKIRKAAYNDIKELWERINQRYLLFYDKDLDVNMEDVVLSILEAENVFYRCYYDKLKRNCKK